MYLRKVFGSRTGQFSGNDVVFFLGFHLYPDVYAFSCKAKEPSPDLRVSLEANGFEEKEGWWLKLVSRDGMRGAVADLDSAIAQRR